MPRFSHIALGLVLLIALGVLAASCSGPGTTPAPPDPEERAPQQAYRIQVYMTSDQAEAEQMAEQVRAWWRELPDDERPPALAASELAPEVVWQQPYYRVRIGQFTERSAAEPALSAVRAAFDDAFIVPVRLPAARR